MNLVIKSPQSYNIFYISYRMGYSFLITGFQTNLSRIMDKGKIFCQWYYIVLPSVSHFLNYVSFHYFPGDFVYKNNLPNPLLELFSKI